jgi:hypothetical protein
MVSPWLTPCAGLSNVVDIFDATAGTLSTAALSVGRSNLAATSLPSAGLAIFAGGYSTCLLCLFELMGDAMVCEETLRQGGEWYCADGESMAHAFLQRTAACRMLLIFSTRWLILLLFLLLLLFCHLAPLSPSSRGARWQPSSRSSQSCTSRSSASSCFCGCSIGLSALRKLQHHRSTSRCSPSITPLLLL